MYFDERSNSLLKEVLNNPEISGTKLEKKYQLSRRQVSYSFGKINDWLGENHLPLIKRSNSGKFIINPVLIDLYGDQQKDTKSKYISSEKERAQLILLMILSSEEELSLIHFTSALEVSKNTILRDLKFIQGILNTYQLEIYYSRIHGYDIRGDEWNIRRLLVDILQSVLNMFNSRWFIQELIHLSEDYIDKLQQQMEKVENQLHLKFIDERIDLLPYVIAILLKRINKGKFISSPYHIDYEELSDTKEYEAAEILIEDNKEIPKAERLYITLQLLTSSKVFASRYLTDNELSQLTSVLDDCLDLFEKMACVKLKDKKMLLKRITLHMKPAYYRIKYNLTTNYSLVEKVSNQYKAVQYILKDSIKPLEDYIGCEIPKSEFMFLTIIVGGHLINSGETITMKKKAVVVCPNGVTISGLMENTLKELFPEFQFIQAFSIREYQQSEMEFDIVFSPVPLQTDKQLFIVDRFISDYEKVELRQRVMKRLLGFKSSAVNAEHIIGIVEKYAKVEDKESLVGALNDYFSFSSQVTEDTDYKNEYQLSDLITPNSIVIRNHVATWHDAIQIAAGPLLNSGKITENYVETMKQQYKTMSPYIILRMNIAIPHASPEDGVNGVGMSLLKINDGIDFDENNKVHLVVVISAIDKKTHFNALMQLMKLANSEEDIQRIIQMKNVNEIFQMIETYSK